VGRVQQDEPPDDVGVQPRDCRRNSGADIVADQNNGDRSRTSINSRSSAANAASSTVSAGANEVAGIAETQEVGRDDASERSGRPGRSLLLILTEVDVRAGHATCQ
jgi:hypothetical protein